MARNARLVRMELSEAASLTDSERVKVTRASAYLPARYWAAANVLKQSPSSGCSRQATSAHCRAWRYRSARPPGWRTIDQLASFRLFELPQRSLAKARPTAST